jgi:hypothetical protein
MTKSLKIFHACHGIFLVYSFSTWKISSDVAKYLMTCLGILCQVTKGFLESTKVY